MWGYSLLSCSAISLSHFSPSNQPGVRKFCSPCPSLVSDAHTFVHIHHTRFPSRGLLPPSAAALPNLGCAYQPKVWLKCRYWFGGTAREPVTLTSSQVMPPVLLVPGPHREQRESVWTSAVQRRGRVAALNRDSP